MTKNFIGWDRNGDGKFIKTEKECLLPKECFIALNYCQYHAGQGFDYDPDICLDNNEFLTVPLWYKTVELNNNESYFEVDHELQKRASKLRLPHRLVTVTCPGDDWKDLPDKWYECKPKEKIRHSVVTLQPVSSRPFIKVLKPFVQVQLDSFIKKSRLTVEDILFACRTLCGDQYRSYESFTVRSDRGGHLELDIEIDNYST